MSLASLQQATRDVGFVVLDRVSERASRSIEDSETAYLFDLLYLGECLTKVVTLGMVAGLQAERESHRYRVEHNLVRANGLGAWAEALDDVITGPASQALSASARPEVRGTLTGTTSPASSCASAPCAAFRREERRAEPVDPRGRQSRVQSVLTAKSME